MFRFKQNIGILNALIRITIGLTMISLSSAKLVRKPWCFSSKLFIFLGAMKVAEGIVRFCPVVEAMKFGKYMNLPVMSMLNKGNDKKQEAEPFSGDSEKHRSTSNSSDEKHETASNNGYDASDKQTEKAIEEMVLGTNSL